MQLIIDRRIEDAVMCMLTSGLFQGRIDLPKAVREHATYTAAM